MAAQPIYQPQLFDLPFDPIGPEQIGRASISEIYVKQILTKGGGSLKHFDYSLNPYVGCGFGCSYCFASFFQAEQHRFDTWGEWIQIKANAVEVLKAKRDLKGAKIFMSSATDPYQPLEGKVELTRRLVEVMSDRLRQPRLVVQTRSPLAARDIDLFKRFTSIRVNMSITTDSEEIRKKFEPSCASIERRLEAIAEIKAAGIPTSVCMCPLLPLEDPESFAKRLKAVNADHYVTCFFHETDKAFAANTREDAWKLAESLGWDRATYKRTAAILRNHFPRVNDGSRGFDPS